MRQYVRGGDGTSLGRAGQRSHAELDQHLPIALSKQGATIVMDQLEAWAIEGRQFHAQQGDAATLVDLVETAYDEDQPQFALVVPSGTIAIPTSISLNFHDQAASAGAPLIHCRVYPKSAWINVRRQATYCAVVQDASV